MAFFELYRRDAARRIVATFGVVEHLDVVKDISTGILPGWVDLAANPLTFEQLEEALGHGVVVAVATPAHAADQVMVAQKGLPLVAGELAALIEMNHDRRMRLAQCVNSIQRSP